MPRLSCMRSISWHRCVHVRSFSMTFEFGLVWNASKLIEDFHEFHDLEIVEINVDTYRSSISIRIDDLHSSTYGHPEYPGRKSVYFDFTECEKIMFDSILKKNQRITIAYAELDNSNEKCIKFWTSSGLLELSYGRFYVIEISGNHDYA